MRRPPIVTAARLVFSSGLSSSGLASALASDLSSGLTTVVVVVVVAGAARARVGRAHETAARTALGHTSFCICRDSRMADPRGATEHWQLPPIGVDRRRSGVGRASAARRGCDVARRGREGGCYTRET